MGQDKQKELSHDKEIVDNAEFFWGWDTPAGRLRAERRADLIISEVRERNCKSLLEIGAGTGVFSRYFCDAGLHVTGIDISEELLSKARSDYGHYPHLVLEVADVEDLPYEDNTFDAVVGICVLHHLDLISALKEVRRVVREGGLIVFSEPNMMNPQLMVQKNVPFIKRLPFLGETEDETAFFKWQMKNTLREIGFVSVVITPFDFLHPWTPRPLIPFVERLGFFFEKTPLVREIAGSLLIKADKRLSRICMNEEYA